MKRSRWASLLLAAFVGLSGQRADAMRTPLADVRASITQSPQLTAATAASDVPSDAWLVESIIPLGTTADGQPLALISLLVPLSSLDELPPTSTRVGPYAAPETHTRVFCIVQPPLGLTAWEWMLTGKWNPSEQEMAWAYEGLRSANPISQAAAGAIHVLSDTGGHLVDIGRGAVYAVGATDQTTEEFAAGSWGALAKKQATQMAHGEYTAGELGKDILCVQLAMNPFTGSAMAGYRVGTGIYEGDAVAIGEGAAHFGMLTSAYKGIELRAGPSPRITARQSAMLEKDVGYNVSPESWFSEFPALGREGTFLTDFRAVGEVLGPVRADQSFTVSWSTKPGQISYFRAWRLERSLGLEWGSLR